MKQSLLLALLLGSAGLSAQTPTVPTPQQTDQIIQDNNSNSKADPGDKIRYKVTIQNTGSGTATGATLNAAPDAKTTFSAGSFRSSPLAFDDGPYTCIGNVGITVPDGASDLLANDFDDNIPGLTATAGTFATTQGGSITIADNGSFSYNPPRGYEGTDTYTYTLNDGNAVAGVTATSTATVTITVSGMIWFINKNVGACASACDGRMSNPYTSLAAFNTDNTGIGVNPADNDNIFIYESATAYTSGIVLRSGQKLFGQDATVTLRVATGLSQPTFGNALPTTNSGNGTLATITNSSGNGVALNSGNTLNGFSIGNCSGSGLFGSGFGTVSISTVSINSTGQAIELVNGTANGTFGAVSSSGGMNNILLNVVTCNLNLGSGALSGATGRGFYINGGNGTVSYSGSISNTLDQVVHIRQWTSGTATLSGNITASANGIVIASNSGGTIHISGSSKNLNVGANNGVSMSNNTGTTVNITGGGMVITTTTGTGFTATGGGTVTVQGTGNTISSTTGTAFNMTSTTIGGSGITFQSISKNGGTNNAITLSNTGAGAFSVTGTGSAGSGGTLQNISGADAVSLNTTNGLVSLQYLVIQDITDPNDASAALQTHSGVDGIHGRDVNGGLTLSNSTIQRISDNAINGTVDASPVTSNPTNTTWSGLTLTNCTFQNTNRFNVANKGDATNESAIIIWGVSGTVSVTGNTFQNCSSGIDFVTHTSGTLDMTVQSNTFNTLYKEIGTNSVGRFGISVVQEGTLTTSTVRVGDWQNETNAALGNTFTNAGNVAAIRVISNTTAFGNLKALIAKNTFTVTDHSSPGQASGNTTYNIPQSGVLLRHVGNSSFAGGGNFESIVAANTFNECMHADGGLGNVSVIMEKGDAETIIRNNTFNKPWDLPMELRSDGKSNTQTSNQILVTGNTHIDGNVGDGTTDLGGQSPYGSTYVQVRDNGRMDLTMRDEATPLGLTDLASSTGTFSLFTQTTTAGDILNIFLNNIQGPRGYRLSHAAGSSYNLFRNGSGSGTAQGVLQDNNVRGGGGVDNTNPPTVTTTGTITLTNTAPVLPNI